VRPWLGVCRVPARAQVIGLTSDPTVRLARSPAGDSLTRWRLDAAPAPRAQIREETCESWMQRK